MKKVPSHFHEELPELLAQAGFGADAISGLLDLDATLFQWHRLSTKGELPSRLLSEMGLDIELGQFAALTAIVRVQEGIGREAEPVTIGILAEEMSIDPSRASRIASDLISRGYIRREAAQDDGRKSVLVLTQQAYDAFRKFKELKWSKRIAQFSRWPEDDIITFARLLERYVGGLRASVPAQD